MAEFKKLSEVEKLETASDDASVLVEEGGEIKRVPKKEVGGAGGYIVTLTESNFERGETPICIDNYDELYDVLMAGGSAWIDAGAVFGLSYSYMNLIIDWLVDESGLNVGVLGEGEYSRILFPNGSHNLPSSSGGPV